MRLRWFSLTLLVLLVFTVIPPAQAQTANWSGTYFNNPYLLAPGVLEYSAAAIAFNWGNGSPAPEINPDNFSVRWASDTYFTAGNYRFYALADDNVRVTVDNQRTALIDTFNHPAVGQIVTADTTLTEGVHHIQVDYREWSGNAYLYVSWGNPNASAPNFPTPPPLTNVGLGTWTAQYYANVSLQGTPFLIQAETTPAHNWGANAPAVNLPVDNFSARWTSNQFLNSGNYQLSVRADDGVRVFVDGILYINEWHLATGATYAAYLALAAGQHNFMVEYFEAGGVAYLDFDLTRTSAAPPISVNYPPASTGITGTVVTALRLNVRSAPSVNAPILTKINQNETYPVLGRNADSTWWQMNVNGTVGWVYWRFLNVSNPAAVTLASATSSSTDDQPPTTGYALTTQSTVNVRSTPGTNSAIIGQIAPGQRVAVVGRNAGNNWWQVNYRQITGWVNARWAVLQPTANINAIPVTG